MDAKRRNSGPPRGGASQAKRGKTGGDWEDSPSIFEEELALFEEADMEAEEREGQAGHDVIPVGERRAHGDVHCAGFSLTRDSYCLE